MGLEIAEIAMDIEDCFNVTINEDTPFLGSKVSAWEDYVIEQCRTRTFPSENDIHLIINDSSPISKKQYRLLRNLLPTLPSKLFGVPKQFSQAPAVIKHYHQWMNDVHNNTSDENNIRIKVRSIIKERLCLQFDVLPEHDLVKDLGAG